MSVHQHVPASGGPSAASAWTSSIAPTNPPGFSSAQQWPGYTPIWDYERHPVAPLIPDTARSPRHTHPDHKQQDMIECRPKDYRRHSTHLSSSSTSSKNSSSSSLQHQQQQQPTSDNQSSSRQKELQQQPIRRASTSSKTGRRPLLLRLFRKPNPSLSSPTLLVTPRSTPLSTALPSSLSSPSEPHDRDPNLTTQPLPQPQPQSKPNHRQQHTTNNSMSPQLSSNRGSLPHSLNNPNINSNLQGQVSPPRSLPSSREHSRHSSITSLFDDENFDLTSPSKMHVSTQRIQSRTENGRRIPSAGRATASASASASASLHGHSPRPSASLSQRRRGIAVAAIDNASSSGEEQEPQQQQQLSPLEEQQLRWHQDWLGPSGAMLSRFRDRPARFNCPHCKALKVVSVTEFVPGVMSYLVAFGLLFLTLGTLSYVPFRKDHEGTKDCVHWCPKCNQRVARFNRANASWEWL